MSLPRQPRAVAAFVLAAAAAVTGLAGCGGGTDVDHTKAAETIKASLESKREGFGVEVETVECPSGVAAAPGGRFECTVLFGDGKVRHVEVRIRDGKADLSLESLSARRFDR